MITVRWRPPKTALIVIAFSLVVMFSPNEVVSEEAKQEKEEESEEEVSYLYDTDDASPVQEYKQDEEDDKERPSFLFDKDNGPRVVEFYAPWCPHVSTV